MFRSPASIMLILILILSSAASGVTVVDDDGVGDFTKIQDAINASEMGDEIVVKNGTYPENLLVDKSVVLRGQGNPVIKGSGLSEPLITITSENVTLEGFTFSGGESDSFDSGAVLVLADGSRIMNNTIFGSSGNGLCLRDSGDHLAAGNLIRDNRYGGISALGANNNELFGNRIFSNGKWGINMEECGYNMLVDNDVSENYEVGLQLSGTFYANFVSNRIGLNEEDGVYILGSDNNAFIENEILDNGLNGIVLDGAPNNFFLNNVIRGSGEDGVLVVRSSDDCVITGNVISDNSLNGSLSHTNRPWGRLCDTVP